MSQTYSERDARKGHHREYWSRRGARWGAWGWGKVAKILTHRKERAADRRMEHAALTAGDESE